MNRKGERLPVMRRSLTASLAETSSSGPSLTPMTVGSAVDGLADIMNVSRSKIEDRIKIERKLGLGFRDSL